MRPRITLSYAQSLDGCLAGRPGQRLMLSGPEAMRMTHALRAQHDAILVGIGTLLADNPRLNVRLVDGPSPQPVLLDSHLRCLLDCHLLRAPVRPLWIYAAPLSDADISSRSREECLVAAGAQVQRIACNSDTGLDLRAMLADLFARGIRTLMVEGGARVITGFLRAQLADRLVLTVAPRLVGGLPAIAPQSFVAPVLQHITQRMLGPDNIVEADLVWGQESN